MAYRVTFTHRAVRDLDSLPAQIRHRIGQALERFREEPLRHARPMADPALGGYRFRIGDYRAIFDLQGDEIIVLRVGHRGQIYRR